MQHNTQAIADLSREVNKLVHSSIRHLSAEDRAATMLTIADRLAHDAQTIEGQHTTKERSEQ